MVIISTLDSTNDEISGVLITKMNFKLAMDALLITINDKTLEVHKGQLLTQI